MTIETAIFMILFGVKTCGVPEKPCKNILFSSQTELVEYLKNNSPRRNQRIFKITPSGPISMGGYPPGGSNPTNNLD